MEPFDTEPAGLLIHKDFISPAQEAALIQLFQTELTWPERKGRRSLHYGYTFSYRTFAVDLNVPYAPFPGWLRALLPSDEAGGPRRAPDQVCVQHYPPGTGIPPHADTHGAFDDRLYALSLGAPVVMQFGRAGGRRVDVDVAPRSMMLMRGDARLHWTHGIRARKTDTLGEVRRPRGDRWSITYRWLRAGGECECGDEALCDTAQRRAGVERAYRWKEQLQAGGAAAPKEEP